MWFWSLRPVKNRFFIDKNRFLAIQVSIRIDTAYQVLSPSLAGLVWCLRKIRHMAESSKLPVRIYTDHGASLGIAKQSSLETTSAERSNLRLV